MQNDARKKQLVTEIIAFTEAVDIPRLNYFLTLLFIKYTKLKVQSPAFHKQISRDVEALITFLHAVYLLNCSQKVKG